MKNRDDFPIEVIRVVKLQAAYICSNPSCRKSTVAPSLNDDMQVQFMGKVAHITAAAPKGPRYDKEMSVETRKSVSNAIFLCSNCADLIDKNNGIDYAVHVLHQWKQAHANWVLNNLNKKEKDNSFLNIANNHQSGGIIAHTVNIGPQSTASDHLKRDHDMLIFNKSAEIFNEEAICRVCSDLGGNAECKIDDTHALHDLENFFDKEGNCFLNERIDAAKVNFKESIHRLLDFISVGNFDKWPYNDNSSNFSIQLRPEWLRDTAYRSQQDGDWEKWSALFSQLNELTQQVRNSYNEFRRMIKNELYI